MFDILPKELRVIGDTDDLDILCEAQKKHTLQQVIEWGNEVCPHQSSDVSQPTLRLHYQQDILKKECDKCWAELVKEVEK